MKATGDVVSAAVDDCATMGVSAESGTARGKVRKIEGRGIITARAIKPYKYWAFGRFLKKNFC